MKKKHIIFDFDGTLFDSNGIIVDSWQHVFRHYTGRDGDEGEIYRSFGETIRFTVERFFPEANPDEAVQVYRDYQAANYTGKIGLFDGVEELLHQLRESGRTVSIVTSRTRATTEEYIRELGIADLFDIIITCNDTDKHKPDPTPLLMAMEALGGTAEETLMLGDTKFDIGCATNAGVDSVLVDWSHEVDEEELAALGYVPTYRIASPSDLFQII